MRIRQGLHFAGHDLNVCKEMKGQAQAHYFGTILAKPVPV